MSDSKATQATNLLDVLYGTALHGLDMSTLKSQTRRRSNTFKEGFGGLSSILQFGDGVTNDAEAATVESSECEAA